MTADDIQARRVEAVAQAIRDPKQTYPQMFSWAEIEAARRALAAADAVGREVTQVDRTGVEYTTECDAEIARLRAALEFYADEANYELHNRGSGWSAVVPGEEGQRARDALRAGEQAR